jgi:hypothetical protein
MGKFVLEAKFCVTAIVVSEHDQRNIKTGSKDTVMIKNPTLCPTTTN